MQILTFLEQSSYAFIWINKVRDIIKMHGGTVKNICFFDCLFFFFLTFTDFNAAESGNKYFYWCFDKYVIVILYWPYPCNEEFEFSS